MKGISWATVLLSVILSVVIGSGLSIGLSLALTRAMLPGMVQKAGSEPPVQTADEGRAAMERMMRR